MHTPVGARGAQLVGDDVGREALADAARVEAGAGRETHGVRRRSRSLRRPCVSRLGPLDARRARARRRIGRSRRVRARRARSGSNSPRSSATPRPRARRARGSRATRRPASPACRVSALTSLRSSNRLQRRSRSAMRCSASSASDAGPPTMITWASLPIARNRRSAGMGRRVRLGRRGAATAATLVERLAAAESSSVATVVAAVVASRSRRSAVERVAVGLGGRGHAAGQGEQAATLSEPAMRRARRAGCGRLLAGSSVSSLPPRAGTTTASAPPVSATLESMKNRARTRTGRSGPVLGAFLAISQLYRNYGDETGAMQHLQGSLG